MWFKRSNKYPCAKCLLQFESKSHIRNHIKNHMVQDYDLDTMQNRMINSPHLDRICSFCGLHLTTNPDLSIGTRLSDFISDFFSEQGRFINARTPIRNKNDPKLSYMNFVMQYHHPKGPGKDFHTNLGVLRNILLKYETNPSVNAELDLRRRVKVHGQTLIEFMMKEHLLRDHGFQLNQDNFEGLAPFKCGQCFRSYYCWNKYKSHHSLHHRNADFNGQILTVKRSNLPVPTRSSNSNVQANVPISTIQVNQTNLVLQQATTKKAVIYPNRINLTDGMELVNRLKCTKSFVQGNRAQKRCTYETFFPEMIQHHIGLFSLLSNISVTFV